MKIAIIIQRYGTEITGGSEHLCRLTAERLVQRGHEIDVLTSCAKDYISWKNEYSPGRTVLNGVNVYRFPTTNRATWNLSTSSPKKFTTTIIQLKTN